MGPYWGRSRSILKAVGEMGIIVILFKDVKMGLRRIDNLPITELQWSSKNKQKTPKSLIGGICQFPWGKYSKNGNFILPMLS